MALLDEVVSLQTDLRSLSTLAQKDLSLVWTSIQDRDPTQVRAVLREATPALVSPYTDASGAVSAEFYDDLLPDSSYRAFVAPGPDEARIAASVDWAVAVGSKPDTARDVFDLLSGSLQRMIFGTSRDTIIDNTRRERVAYARYASANACQFCKMLSTRGAVYASERSAGKGKKYHDNCHCMAVPVRGGVYEPPPFAKKWEQDYQDARKLADSGKPNDILNAWRRMDYVPKSSG